MEVVIEVYGYGSEVGHIGVTKKAWDYWSKQEESELIDYMHAWDVEDVSLSIPDSARFLQGNGYHNSWYDADGIIEQNWGTTTGGATLDIKADGEIVFLDYLYKFKGKVINTDFDSKEFDKAEYIITIISSEKGGFINYEFEVDAFDVDKLTFFTETDWEGDNVVQYAEYDGELLDNAGGDTRGKGISAYCWEA